MHPSADPTNQPSELSVLSDHVMPQHLGQLARRNAQRSGNIHNLPTLAQDRKVKKVLKFMREQGFSLVKCCTCFDESIGQLNRIN